MFQECSWFGRSRLLLLLVALGAFFLILSTVSLPSIAQSNVRVIDDTIPKHLPISVKIKKEKESKVRDFANQDWARDLEVEVTNTSDKPIYYLAIFVVMPEITDGGMEVAFPLKYGRPEFIEADTKPGPDDVPILPKDTYTFKIPDDYEQAWEAHRSREHRPNPAKLVFLFAHLSFGDGTGYESTDGVPFPHKADPNALARCSEKAGALPRSTGDLSPT